VIVPPASVEALQVNSTEVGDVAVAVTLPGVVGTTGFTVSVTEALWIADVPVPVTVTV
jgi:hypothetical protein